VISIGGGRSPNLSTGRPGPKTSRFYSTISANPKTASGPLLGRYETEYLGTSPVGVVRWKRAGRGRRTQSDQTAVAGIFSPEQGSSPAFPGCHHYRLKRIEPINIPSGCGRVDPPVTLIRSGYGLLQGIFLIGIRGYQRVISPLFPSSCRFYPTCSEYAIQAIQTYGLCRGIILSLKRIGRCHPFSPGGFDPIR